MKYLLLLALLIPTIALADTVAGSFVPPTEREDGEVLPLDQIGGYKVYLNGSPLEAVNPLPATATDFTLTLPSGNYVLTLTTFDIDGRESIESTPVSIAIPFNPNAPSNVTITFTIDINVGIDTGTN